MKNIKSWLVIIACFALYYCMSGNNDEDAAEENDSEEVQVSGSSSERAALFASEQEVRTYLCSHRFSSEDGYTLTFSSNANEVQLNGRTLTSSATITLTSSSSAHIRTSGPYGNTTFRLATIGADAVIKDSNDGTLYYSN